MQSSDFPSYTLKKPSVSNASFKVLRLLSAECVSITVQHWTRLYSSMHKCLFNFSSFCSAITWTNKAHGPLNTVLPAARFPVLRVMSNVGFMPNEELIRPENLFHVCGVRQNLMTRQRCVSGSEHWATEHCYVHAGRKTLYLGHSLNFSLKYVFYSCSVSEGRKEDQVQHINNPSRGLFQRVRRV